MYTRHGPWSSALESQSLFSCSKQALTFLSVRVASALNTCEMFFLPFVLGLQGTSEIFYLSDFSLYSEPYRHLEDDSSDHDGQHMISVLCSQTLFFAMRYSFLLQVSWD